METKDSRLIEGPIMGILIQLTIPMILGGLGMVIFKAGIKAGYQISLLWGLATVIILACFRGHLGSVLERIVTEKEKGCT